jgi:hypothetical protein
VRPSYTFRLGRRTKTCRHKLSISGQTKHLRRVCAPPATNCAAINVSPLLRELILSMLREPLRYAPSDRGAHMAALIASELHLCNVLPLSLPWPSGAQLRRVCTAMQRNPTIVRDAEYWAARGHNCCYWRHKSGLPRGSPVHESRER